MLGEEIREMSLARLARIKPWQREAGEKLKRENTRHPNCLAKDRAM